METLINETLTIKDYKEMINNLPEVDENGNDQKIICLLKANENGIFATLETIIEFDKNEILLKMKNVF